MKRAKSLRAVLAAGTARVRAERGLSEEQAAELLRSYGLVTWQAGTLTQVEAGVRPLAVEELLLLCAAYRVSVAELAGSDPDEVELAAGARLPAVAVRALLADGGEELRALPDDALDVPATRPVSAVPTPGRARRRRGQARRPRPGRGRPGAGRDRRGRAERGPPARGEPGAAGAGRGRPLGQAVLGRAGRPDRAAPGHHRTRPRTSPCVAW